MHAPHGLTPVPTAGKPMVSTTADAGSCGSDEHAIDDGRRVGSVRARQHPHRPEPGADRQRRLELPDLGHRGGSSVGPVEHRRGEAVTAWCPGTSCDAWTSAKNQSQPLSLTDPSILSMTIGSDVIAGSRLTARVAVSSSPMEWSSAPVTHRSTPSPANPTFPENRFGSRATCGRGQRRGLDADEMSAVGREPELTVGVDDPTGAAPAGTQVMVAPIFSAPMGLGVGPSVAAALGTAVGASTAAVVAVGCTSAGRAGEPHGLREC